MDIVVSWFRLLAARLRPAPVRGCGECSRAERCGLPPSRDCVIRLQAAERAWGARLFG